MKWVALLTVTGLLAACGGVYAPSWADMTQGEREAYCEARVTLWNGLTVRQRGESIGLMIRRAIERCEEVGLA